MEKVMKCAWLDALGTGVYVVLVASFIYFMGENSSVADKSVFIPIAMLMLLVLSVAIVGSLMFGKPVMWYIDGKKKDALKLLFWTLGIFLVFTVLVLVVVVAFYLM
ncbi:MAG: hypothetical protein ABH864_02280 [archaeon]